MSGKNFSFLLIFVMMISLVCADTTFFDNPDDFFMMRDFAEHSAGGAGSGAGGGGGSAGIDENVEEGEVVNTERSSEGDGVVSNNSVISNSEVDNSGEGFLTGQAIRNIFYEKYSPWLNYLLALLLLMLGMYLTGRHKVSKHKHRDGIVIVDAKFIQELQKIAIGGGFAGKWIEVK